VRHKTDWLKDARWGVFTHYLVKPEMSAEQWQRQVDAFDVEGLARRLRSVGAPYICLTIGQNSGHFCAPNATYDELTGIRPSKCSRRDLVSDLADALAVHGIRLMAYLPAGAPAHDKTACERLQWGWGFQGPWPAVHGGPTTGKRIAEFQRKWEAICRDWSMRFGRKVSGWWIDGCYFADDMYNFPDEPNWSSFAAALRAGNLDSLLAFNPGVRSRVVKHCPVEDYTAGEVDYSLPALLQGRFLDGAQLHILSFLGPTWGAAPPRFPLELVVGYTKYVNACEGVITWDVPIHPSGLVPEPFLEQLAAIARAVR